MQFPRITKPFYGYYIVAVCFATLFMLWGMFINSFGIFFKPMIEDMSWSRGALGGALFMRSIGMAVAGPIAGRIMDRIGPKPVMAAGCIVAGVGMVITSFITHLWQLYVIFAFVGFGLTCSTIIPCSLVISNWFVSRRGTALASAFVGTSVGGAVMSPVATWIILNFSWRTAFLLCGGVILGVVVPAIVLIIRDRPSDIGLEPYRDAAAEADTTGENWGVGVREAFSLPVFWQIATLMFLIALVTNGIHTHSVAFLDDIGHSRERAAYAWSLVMMVMIGGKLAFGPIADRWGAKNAMAAAFIMYSLSILMLTFARPYPVAIVFACLYGFACGAPLTLYPLLTIENLGMKNYATLYGIFVIMAGLGSGLGPVVPGVVFDNIGTYLPVFYVCVVLMLIGALTAASIKSPSVREAPDSL